MTQHQGINIGEVFQAEIYNSSLANGIVAGRKRIALAAEQARVSGVSEVSLATEQSSSGQAGTRRSTTRAGGRHTPSEVLGSVLIGEGNGWSVPAWLEACVLRQRWLHIRLPLVWASSGHCRLTAVDWRHRHHALRLAASHVV